MDLISKKDQPNNSFHQDALAQPLKLKESLRIRDGLGGYDARSVGWPQFKITRFTAPGLSYPWVSDN